MANEMLVNVIEGEESRIAVIDNGQLEELYIERASFVSHVGNIYKARVVNIEAAIQAAFVDFGAARNGFLHVSDLHPKYFGQKKDNIENIGRRKSLPQRPPIQKCLKKGQDLLVQVTKEGINTKGPTLTTYLSLPGKYMVLMPWMTGIGVSQKIEDEAERKSLRDIAQELRLPDNSGIIIRTAASAANKRDLQNDVSYLNRLWGAIRKRIESEKTASEIYQESDLVLRTVRDTFDSGISKILCDSETATRKIRDFLSIVQPRLKSRVVFYDQKIPIFHKYGIEEQIDKIHVSRVELKSGGYIIIEQTEALVAIDVNSGRYLKQKDAEQTALKINVEAAGEIVRQLKLRDLGGLIICDFIDMRSNKNKQAVEKTFREALKSDRARSRALRMSIFGLIEVTRQRMRPSLQSSTSLRCPHCTGTGIIKSYESQAIEVLRGVRMALSREEVHRVELTVSAEVADYLQNLKRGVLIRMESDSAKRILIHADFSGPVQQYRMVCYDQRSSVVKV